MVAPSETVAKQFWHLSNGSAVTATTKPPAEGQQEERQHKADSRQRRCQVTPSQQKGRQLLPLRRKYAPSVNGGRSNLQRGNALDNPIIHAAIKEE